MVCGGESCAAPSAILMLLVVGSPREDEAGRQQLDVEPVPALESEFGSVAAVKRAQAW